MQFTIELDTIEDCRFWYEWFKGRGIPAAIIRLGQNYAVFRGGSVTHLNVRRLQKDGKKDYIVLPVRRTPILHPFTIIESCHGYTKKERSAA